MKTRLIALAVVAVLTATLPAVPARGQDAVRVYVEGEPVAFDQPPIIQGSRVLVPLRGIFEKMGATVEWRPTIRMVVAARGNTLVELTIGSRIAKVNERPITLDVPAMIILGRTLVPLRFISESLGAQVDWNASTRTVLINAGGTAGPPPAPSAQTSTIRGVITNVQPAQSAQDQPRVTIESGKIATTIRVTTETAITRVETSSGAGGSVGVAALRLGDDAEVTLAGDVATRIRITYMMTTGRIEAVAAASRTIVLADGRSIRYIPYIAVLINGQVPASGPPQLRAGQVVELRVNPTTKEAWEANIISQAVHVPTPTQMTLTVTQPESGATVGNPIRVAGATAANARVEIVVTWFLGLRVGSATTTAGPRGRFATQVPITVTQSNSPYLVTVTATHPQLGTEQRQFTVTVGNSQ
jgi:hypothetical protein